VFWGFVAFLAAAQAFANFGPPPSSARAMAVTALAFYAVFAFMAAWVERIAIAARTADGPIPGRPHPR
jgi:uncharacterized membrane protein HdeD (DUF308 family)